MTETKEKEIKIEKEQEKKSLGKQLFEDVFRRADKNDDQAISYEEFIQYFSDGIVNEEDLQEIFKVIDGDSNGVLDLDEIFMFFLKDFKNYEGVFDSVHTVTENTHETLEVTSKKYPEQGTYEQFKTRLYLKELKNRILDLTSPIKRALGVMQIKLPEEETIVTLDEEEEEENEEEEMKKEEEIKVKKKKRTGFIQKQLENEESLQEKLSYQVKRLSKMIKKLESTSPLTKESLNYKISPVSQNFKTEEETGTYYLTSRTFTVEKEKIEVFEKAFKLYFAETNQEEECLIIYLQQVEKENENLYFIYEIWECKKSFEFYCRSETFKTYRKSIISDLKKPMETYTMVVPSAWFIRSNL
ncbi:hypothetical protein M0812_00757 [Anaeramoeba flamelloides]|uniref:Uncharacterized protein n=1 Tax=Anaeramoeba flamelloides TaxID=1746091 RepID=A0AAV8A6X7_9EUKA|nr:hypothetical protein M0812_00757 [Anaeramoeba flamelloides]